jgi:hypothetical protein
MGCPSDFYQISLGPLWYFYDFSIGFLCGFLWDFHENSIGFYDISVGLLLDFYGFRMAFLWNFHGVSMIFP